MGRQPVKKTVQKIKLKWKTETYIGNEAKRQELMLKAVKREKDSLTHITDSLQRREQYLQRQIDSLQRENDSLKVVIKLKP